MVALPRRPPPSLQEQITAVSNRLRTIEQAMAPPGAQAENVVLRTVACLSLDLVKWLTAQRAWSRQTFGPGNRSKGVVAHIRKELAEIEAKPDDLDEWIDVVILAFDGASRAGYTPEEIAQGLIDKQRRNTERDWPDWREASPDAPIEHKRES